MRWKLIRLAILLLAGVGTAISYGWFVELIFGLGLSDVTFAILGIFGGLTGLLIWIILSVP